jgi:hypothetical protein
MKHVVVLLLLVIAPFAATYANDTEKAIGKKAVPFTLEDQFEKKWSWNTHWRGKPTVLVLSDWKGSDHLTKWTSALVPKFKDRVKFASFADVSLAPGFLKGYLRERFREAFTTSVMLDWDGDVFKHYNVQPGLPNVIYVDATGTVRLHTWGKGAQEHVDAFIVNLERLLTE